MVGRLAQAGLQSGSDTFRAGLGRAGEDGGGDMLLLRQRNSVHLAA